jgi:UDP-N-acetylmuramoyl-L-alanyl-D-glutamate--2,6-diaminopimelate ligase
MVRLSELALACGGRVLRGERVDDPVVLDVELDSRRVAPGGLFAALSGQREDGARFTADARARGASALLGERELPPEQARGLPQWIHEHARRATGEAAALVHGSPSRALTAVGVTGTNGKTTTAWLLDHLWRCTGRSSALLGTLAYRLAGGVELAAAHTMPDACTLQRLLARHRELGGDCAAIEISSHGLEQERHAGLELRVAIFTNLTRDHLDFHGSMQAYAAAKRRLFESLRPGAHAVVHADDPVAPEMIAAARAAGAAVHTYSARSRADLRASKLRTSSEGTSLMFEGMGVSETELHLPLPGMHNVENALAAFAAALLSGASPSALLEGLATALPAPGRLERVPTGERGFAVFVDYAHTPDGLERVLLALRQASGGGRIICVFGCGGDRDRGKRAPMGEVVNRLADVAVVTSDNPRSEEPLAIIAEIAAGMQPERARRVIEADRRAAIGIAVGLARPGDTVLIAGKGHERVQIARGVETPFDDRKVAAEVL